MSGAGQPKQELSPLSLLQQIDEICGRFKEQWKQELVTRVLRSFGTGKRASYARSANRYGLEPDYLNVHAGFRVARTSR
jgi:formylglycine-generating enzyme required for sulfatase activity